VTETLTPNNQSLQDSLRPLAPGAGVAVSRPVTVRELATFLGSLVAEGKGDAEVKFDIGRGLGNLVDVGRAVYHCKEEIWSDHCGWGVDYVSLHQPGNDGAR